MEGRLNLFQRMMLRWRELHPYNPVHVVLIPAPLDRARLQGCIDHHLESLGLTGLAVDLKRWRFRYRGGPANADLSVRAGGGDPIGILSGEIEREFNVRFPGAPAAMPFRFVAVDAGAAFHLALAYDHFVAGGDSRNGERSCTASRARWTWSPFRTATWTFTSCPASWPSTARWPADRPALLDEQRDFRPRHADQIPADQVGQAAAQAASRPPGLEYAQ